MKKKLIDKPYINQLIETLKSTGDLDFLKDLYESLNDTYNDFLIDQESIHKSKDNRVVRHRLHLLCNKFSNLGMISCAQTLRDLEAAIINEISDPAETLKLSKKLKNDAFESLNLFFDEFLA